MVSDLGFLVDKGLGRILVGIDRNIFLTNHVTTNHVMSI